MPFDAWLGHNWIALVQTGILAACLLAISAGLFFDARARRVANLIQLTQEHRDLWERIYSQPELSRILDSRADVARTPITPEEEMFVIFLILHLSSTYFGMRSGFFRGRQGLRKDIERFFSLPIPRAIWEKVEELQDALFVKFVESCFPSSDLSPSR